MLLIFMTMNLNKKAIEIDGNQDAKVKLEELD